MSRSSRILFYSLFCIYCGPRAIASSFHTIHNGTWSSPTVWLNSQVPPLSGGDTIFIHHHITYTSPILLNTTTELIIDTSGSLCGHERFFILNASFVTNYGDFYADTLGINGGHLYNNGFIDLTNMAAVTNGGGIVNNGSMVIGLSFICSQVADAIQESNQPGSFSIYPNPAFYGQEIHLDNLPENCELLIIDLQGKIIRNIKTEQTVSINGMSPGVYFIELKNENLSFHQKIIIAE